MFLSRSFRCLSPLALACAALAPSLTPGIAQGADAAGGPRARLHKVASFDHQVTGVTVSEDGRIFVNFPRWSDDAPVSVAEVMKDGSTRAYPDANWNAWRNARRDELTANDRFVCVQSVVADGRGNLWVLDTGAPAQGSVVPGAPKLVRIALATNQAEQTIAFDETVAPNGSYLNDVRFSNDGRLAYITDSGAKGALVVVNLASGKARRVLDGHPSTQPEKGVVVTADGKPVRRPDGRGVEFAADGIALSNDGRLLYWQAIKGRTLYRIPTSLLADEAASPDSVSAGVERVGENGPADGLHISKKGLMYVTSPQDNAVKTRRLDGGADTLDLLVQDPNLRWPDTFGEGPDGAIYVTASRIMDMSWYKPQSPASLPTTLFRIEQGR